MPLRCHDENQQNLFAFDFSSEAWKALAARNRREQHLRMPCCCAAVTLRTSPRGTRYFAHKAIGACVTAPETEAHLRLKQMAVEAARLHGWEAQTEAGGLSPSGEHWIADVLARKGRAAVAIEIQWSKQTAEETLRRQERYRASGIRGLWLLRKTAVPATEQLPAATIIAEPNQGYTAVLSSDQRLPVSAFLDAAFGGRLKFDVPADAAGIVAVRAAVTNCWHPRCRAETVIVTGIDVTFGPYTEEFSLSRFSKEPELFGSIASHIPRNLGIGAIKHRFSKTMGESYLSNGCIRCDRLFGALVPDFDSYDEQVICTIPVRATPQWRKLHGGSRTWGVFQAEELSQSNLR